MNAKLMISKYYDSLIRDLDIFIEEELAAFSNQELFEKPVNDDDTAKPIRQQDNENESFVDAENLWSDLDLESCTDIWGDWRENSRLEEATANNVNCRPTREKVAFSDPYSNHSAISRACSIIEWPNEPTKIVDHLENIRQIVISQVQNAQKEAFKRYESVKDSLEFSKFSLDKPDKVEELREQLFDNMSIFAVNLDFRNDQEGSDSSPPLKLLIVLDFYLRKQYQQALKYV